MIPSFDCFFSLSCCFVQTFFISLCFFFICLLRESVKLGQCYISVSFSFSFTILFRSYFVLIFFSLLCSYFIFSFISRLPRSLFTFYQPPSASVTMVCNQFGKCLCEAHVVLLFCFHSWLVDVYHRMRDPIQIKKNILNTKQGF